jgi:cytochrome c556
MKKLAQQIVFSAVAIGVAGAAFAQAKPEDAIRARQAIMRVTAINFGPVANMAQDKTPYNKDVFVANAVRMESVWAMNAAQFFIAGSDKPVAGAKIASFTDAKPEIWSQPDKFKSAANHLGEEIGKLAQAARSGDEKAMKAAAGDVGKACKACHDDFRMK